MNSKRHFVRKIIFLILFLNVASLSRAQEFEKVVMQSQIPVVVDFWSPWCNPCKMIAPTLEKLAKELGQMANQLREQLGDKALNDALSRAAEQLGMSKGKGMSKDALDAANESLQLSQEELQRLAETFKDAQNLEDALKNLAAAKQLNEQGITIVMVTHELDIARYCKRNIILRDGRVVSDTQVQNRFFADKELQRLRAEREAVKLA